MQSQLVALQLGPKIEVLPSPVNTRYWKNLGSEAIDDFPATIHFPYSSFRILTPIDMTTDDWWIAPLRFMLLRTDYGDGALMLLLIKKTPRANMTDIDLGWIFEEKFREIVNPSRNSVNLKVSEAGIAQRIPLELPKSVFLIRGENFTDDQNLELFRSSHILVSTSFSNQYEYDVLQSMAVELPAVAYPQESLRDLIAKTNAFPLFPVNPSNPKPDFEHTALSSIIRKSMEPTSTDSLRRRAIRARHDLLKKNDSAVLASWIRDRLEQVIHEMSPQTQPHQPLKISARSPSAPASKDSPKKRIIPPRDA